MRLVGKNEDVAQTGELLRHRRDEVVADEDVLVLFLHQFVARGHDDLYDVLAGGEHAACRTRYGIAVLSGLGTQAVQFVPVGLPVVGSRPVTLGNEYMPS